MNEYARFGLMVTTATAIMLGLMYLHTLEMAHVRWSETRFYMALLMGATMAIVMLAFMWDRFENRRLNFGIIAGSALIFTLSLWLVRSQTTIADVSYMKAMIPHHSIAILTSQRANISDPRVRELADEIIAAQRREIDEMNQLIADLESEWAGTRSLRGAPTHAPAFSAAEK